ncbi:GNAT family N-acetyltransferase [Maliponia aquimaris]|uniref:N-acetylglutamate synthase n=1 Tax=Maliponia aquimaris TaxID=1673631 RepID=A0A238KH83_9RHOB|nr:GNAT family N-acetyltransferase [Maliponia aquimaris]SMX41446.1 N-acetylglutamate synthase [Maliponia aquimaris]
MTAGILLRTARQSDITALDRLFRRSYSRLLAADYPPSTLVTAVPAIARAQPDLLASGLFYVVEDSEQRVLGAGGWSLGAPGRRPAQPGIGHIRHVATDPDATRRGVGRLLLEHILRVAEDSGMARMHCQSTLTAVPFYRAMGFVAQGDMAVPLPGGIVFPTVFMVRPLG